MPVEEIFEGFFRLILRGILYFIVEILFHVVLSAPGEIIGSLISQRTGGPGKWLVFWISFIFWVGVLGVSYYYIYER